MLDFSTKEHVRSFVVSNLRQDRRIAKREISLGRTIVKHGVACATTMVTDCWRVYDPSVEQYKYVYLAGVARQHPKDLNVKYADGVEIAHEHALANPVLRYEFDDPIPYGLVEDLMWGYIAGLPVKLVKTKKEIDFDHQFDFDEDESFWCPDSYVYNC